MTAIALYLLKVSLCSGILFLYYHLALRNKLFHQWNRFYLLLAVVLSLCLPFIQFTIWPTTDHKNNAIDLILLLQSADNYLEEVTIASATVLSPQQWLVAGYCLVSLALFASFLLSLIRIQKLIQTHPRQSAGRITIVRTKEPSTPFSFFRFIFWNDNIHLLSETGQQIFQHELAHVEEKHSLDKVFLQSVLVVFWFNPFFWLLRRELTLLHEFIADKKAAGEKGAGALANMILQAAYPQQYHAITNPFFHTAIKRRLHMLTKIENPKLAYLSRIVVLPLLATLIFAFTVRAKGTEEKSPNDFTGQAKVGHILMQYDTVPKKEASKVDVRINKKNKPSELTVTYADGTSGNITIKTTQKGSPGNQNGPVKTNKANEKQPVQKENLTQKAGEGTNPPLFFLDGKEITKDEMNGIDPATIESINVLKDKAAVEKYGEKGKNGVIEIRLKNRKSNNIKVE